MPLLAEKRSEALECLSELSAQYPRSKAVEDLILLHAQGESFKVKVDAVLQNALRKGVPSLFTSMAKYYKDADKEGIISKLVNDYHDCLKLKGNFTGTDGMFISCKDLNRLRLNLTTVL